MAAIKNHAKNLANRIRANSTQHVWQFSRVGGVNRVNLESGRDLLSLDQLDQKLWTVLSCPVYGLEIDSKTLELIDRDQDQRIRVPEILAAVKWITSVIKNPDDLLGDNQSLPLSAINDTTEEGKLLLASARQILANIGKPDELEITVDQTSDTTAIFANTLFNGDGVITEDSTDDADLKKLIAAIIASVGSVDDLNGKAGISAVQIETFYKESSDFSTWHSRAELDRSGVLPYGDATAAAFDAFVALKPKAEDYYMRCRLAAFDSESAAVLNVLNSQYEEIRTKNIATCIETISGLPLSRIEPGKAMPLTIGINPAWEAAVTAFKTHAVEPILGSKESLTEAEWKKIEALFTGYQAWQGEKSGIAVEALGIDAVRKLLNSTIREALEVLIDKDKELEENTKNIMKVDQLARYYRDLFRLLKNYVTFYDFYSPDDKAIFQAGQLYIDQRRCDLCIKVNDMPKHDAIAKTSGICLIYCDCNCKRLGKKMVIVAALTDGDFDNIEVGRNAIFYDNLGNDWDATIIKVVENPISIREAFWTPYRRTAKFISTQIENFASSKDKEQHETMAARVQESGAKLGNKPAADVPKAPPFDIGKFVGIFAAISLALGAIGSVIMSALTGFLSLTWWKMPIAFFAIMLIISGPSMILAWLKLRKRNLAPLLDANGWAINARAIINIIFGKTLTQLVELPQNSRVNLVDPFAKKKNPYLSWIIVIIAIAATLYLLWHLKIIHLPWVGDSAVGTSLN